MAENQSTDHLDREEALYRAKSVLESVIAAYNGGDYERIAEPTYALKTVHSLIEQALEGSRNG